MTARERQYLTFPNPVFAFQAYQFFGFASMIIERRSTDVFTALQAVPPEYLLKLS